MRCHGRPDFDALIAEARNGWIWATVPTTMMRSTPIAGDHRFHVRYDRQRQGRDALPEEHRLRHDQRHVLVRDHAQVDQHLAAAPHLWLDGQFRRPFFPGATYTYRAACVPSRPKSRSSSRPTWCWCRSFWKSCIRIWSARSEGPGQAAAMPDPLSNALRGSGSTSGQTVPERARAVGRQARMVIAAAPRSSRRSSRPSTVSDHRTQRVRDHRMLAAGQLQTAIVQKKGSVGVPILHETVKILIRMKTAKVRSVSKGRT